MCLTNFRPQTISDFAGLKVNFTAAVIDSGGPRGLFGFRARCAPRVFQRDLLPERLGPSRPENSADCRQLCRDLRRGPLPPARYRLAASCNGENLLREPFHHVWPR